MGLSQASIKTDIIAKTKALMGSSYNKVEHESLIEAIAEAVALAVSEEAVADEVVSTNGDAAEALSVSVFKSTLVTSGSEGAEEAELGDGSGVEIGTRKLIVLGTRTHADDSVVLDDANFSQGADSITAIALDAANEFLLVEWQGASWEVIKASSGVVAVA